MPDENYPTYLRRTASETKKELFQESKAARLMRDDICFLIGWTKVDDPEISKRLDDILDNHTKNRNKKYDQ